MSAPDCRLGAVSFSDEPGSITFSIQPPTLLAGRLNTWHNPSEMPLGLFAGPAVVFIHEQVVPARS
jgi:hypothetical protein